MANPPFNVGRVDKDRLKDDPRFPFGLPRVDNANYLWIQLFFSALNLRGRAGFVMANSASDARGSELEIRRKLTEAQAVDVVVAVGSNFFYTVTLPCTRPRNDPDLYGGPYPFVQTGDIKAADLRLREFSQTYSETGLAQSKVWAPGTLCITIDIAAVFQHVFESYYGAGQSVYSAAA